MTAPAIGFARIGGRSVVRAGSWLSLSFREATLARVLLLGALIAAVAASVLPMGSYEIAAGQVWSALLHPELAAPHVNLIVWEFRVPRILLGAVIGGMLGLAGALMQSATRNGLADPGLLGVSEGAQVVMIFLIVAHPLVDVLLRPVLAMAGGFAVLGVVLMLTRRADGARLILVGLGVSAMLSAVVSIFITYGRITNVQTAMVWMAGSLNASSWTFLKLVAPWAIGGLAAAIWSARATDATLLGEAAATGLGVRPQRVQLVLVTASVALTATSVAAVGTLGFVGLIAPHMARFLLASNQAALIGGSVVCGAAMVLIADSVGRLLLAPIQIPAGIVMALAGVPFFLWLLWRRRHSL